MCEICQNWARMQFLPTNHHENCPHFNDSLIDVFRVSNGSSSYYTTDRFEAFRAAREEGEGEPMTVTEEKMHKEIFDNLPEFDGF